MVSNREVCVVSVSTIRFTGLETVELVTGARCVVPYIRSTPISF